MRELTEIELAWLYMSYLFVIVASIVTVFVVARIAAGLIRHWNFNAVRDTAIDSRADKQWENIDRCLRQTLRVHSIAQRPATWKDVLVTRILPESQDVMSFYFVSVDGRPLPSFLPGQHIVVQRHQHPELPDDSRCYSLSSDCNEGYWRISVKNRSTDKDSFSRWLCEDVCIGDTLRVRGPSGRFYLNARPQQNIVLACAGIGITPLIPMLIESLRRQQFAIHVFCQFRDVDHMPFASSIMNLANSHASLQAQIWISHLSTHIRIGDSELFRQGKFSAENILTSLAHFGNENETTEFYLCGPESWQANLRASLISSGLPGHQIHTELFESPNVWTASEHVASDASSRKIVFAQSGSFAEFEACDPSLLHCAAKNQITIDSGCRSGACGACAVRMLEGKIRYTRTPQYQPRPNEILACICVPETDLVVDA